MIIVSSIFKKFLSTPSARRATAGGDDGEPYTEISIHALREEGDMMMLLGCGVLTEFLSTPSARRATPYNGSMFTKSFEISIHALREEGDRIPQRLIPNDRRFLSTPSARRATTAPYRFRP